MKKIFSACLVIILCLSSFLTSCEKKSQKFTDYSFDFFDTVTTIVGYEENEEKFNSVCAEIKQEMSIYHKLFNIYELYEGVNNLAKLNNLKSGVHEELKVDRKIIDMLLYAKEIYYKTNGKTNVAMGSVLSIWHNYRTDGINHPDAAKLPPMEKLQNAAIFTDIEKVIINEEKSTVYLADPKMTLDVGAVAKGYAVEMVAKAMTDKGISGYLLNVGGNVRVIGEKPDSSPWTVGIENPDKGNAETQYIEYLELREGSLVTSGSYQRYYTVNGKNYHHIIDSETLMPGENFLSVSVVCESSALGDSLSTALFCMTYEEGIELIDSISEAEAMWVMPDGEKKYSKEFLNKKQQ